jgi:YD repeat-containing protein
MNFPGCTSRTSCEDQHWFRETGTNTWEADPGVRVTLSYSATPSPNYTLTDSSQATWKFDGNGRLTEWQTATGQKFIYTYSGGNWTSGYNKLGQITSLLDANGQVTTFSFDDARRLTGINYPGLTTDVTFTYDALGNQVGMVDGTGATSWSYDLNQRPVTITAPVVGAVSDGYDRLGNRTQLRHPNGKVTNYAFDALSRMIQAQDWNTANTTYTYNAFGQLATLSRPNGVNTNFDYDAAQRLNGLAHMRAGNQTVGAYQYAFDAMGNRTAVTETIASPLVAPNTPDPIFANGFENTGTGAWSATSGTGLVVTSTNAITGTFSLSAPITNTTARYVQDNLPTQEGRYRARFAFNPTAITMATNDAFVVFQAYTGTTQMMRVELVRAAAGYQLRVAARNDASSWSTSPAVAISGGVQWVEIDWQRSTGPGANNGRLDWWLNGTAQTAVAGIDNDTRRVDMVRLGAVEGIDAGTVSAGAGLGSTSTRTPSRWPTTRPIWCSWATRARLRPMSSVSSCRRWLPGISYGYRCATTPAPGSRRPGSRSAMTNMRLN